MALQRQVHSLQRELEEARKPRSAQEHLVYSRGGASREGGTGGDGVASAREAMLERELDDLELALQASDTI